MCLFACIVKCQQPPGVNNGNINCTSGDDGVLNYEDTCDVTCNTGYALTGSATRMCLSNGSWSGLGSSCSRGKFYWNCLCHEQVANGL